MSQIIFRFFSLLSLIFFLTIADLRQSEAMLPNDSDINIDDGLTLGQRIAKEIKSSPGYEPKNYGNNTRKCRQVTPSQPTQRQLQAQRQAQQAAATQRAQQQAAAREAQLQA